MRVMYIYKSHYDVLVEYKKNDPYILWIVMPD